MVAGMKKRGGKLKKGFKFLKGGKVVKVCKGKKARTKSGLKCRKRKRRRK